LERQANRCRYEHHAGAAIADEWQCNSLEREEAYHGSDIDDSLDAQPDQYTDHQQAAVRVRGADGDILEPGKERDHHTE
jgi:hypothetical protein